MCPPSKHGFSTASEIEQGKEASAEQLREKTRLLHAESESVFDKLDRIVRDIYADLARARGYSYSIKSDNSGSCMNWDMRFRKRIFQAKATLAVTVWIKDNGPHHLNVYFGGQPWFDDESPAPTVRTALPVQAKHAGVELR